MSSGSEETTRSTSSFQQRRQRVKGKARADVHVHIPPVLAESFQHREQPFESRRGIRWRYAYGLCCRRAVRKILLAPPRLAARPALPAARAAAGRRQFHRLGAADEQLNPRLVLQPLHLMAQRALGDVQLLGSTGQTAGLMDGLDGAEMAEFDVHLYQIAHVNLEYYEIVSQCCANATRADINLARDLR